MITIGMCTDSDTAEQIKKWINDEWNNTLLFNYCDYKNRKELLDSLENHADIPNLLFYDLDVEDDSYEALRNVRRINSSVDIIIIQKDDEHLLEGPLFRAYGYVRSPIKWEIIKPILNNYFDKDIDNSRIYTVTVNREPHKINLDDVYYFESRKRIIYPHGNNVDMHFYKKLEDLERELSSKGFVRCHRSFVVNAKYVDEVHREYLIIRGERVSVGREYYQQSDGSIWKSLRKWSRYGAIIGVGSSFDGVIFRIKPEAEIVFGRDAVYSDIVINDDHVDGKQGVLVFHQQNKTYTIHNVASAAVVVNDKEKIYLGESVNVRSGDFFNVEGSIQRFELG
ncbi:MAG: hypothetical protein E7271_00805 [Lachnospiraceae bacterium]|nr:hypothetical protein [Lachnospiraceae bacterium]